jgi:hypothetical protein
MSGQLGANSLFRQGGEEEKCINLQKIQHHRIVGYYNKASVLWLLRSQSR